MLTLVVREGLGNFSPLAFLRICSDASILRSFSSTYLQKQVWLNVDCSSLLQQSHQLLCVQTCIIAQIAWQEKNYSIQCTYAYDALAQVMTQASSCNTAQQPIKACQAYHSLCRSSQDFRLRSAAFHSVPEVAAKRHRQCKTAGQADVLGMMSIITCSRLLVLRQRCFEKLLEAVSTRSAIKAMP